MNYSKVNQCRIVHHKLEDNAQSGVNVSNALGHSSSAYSNDSNSHLTPQECIILY